jgi:hypothetical protein
VFASPLKLWAFKTAINANDVEIYNNNRNLICECNDEQIDLAICVYGAEMHLYREKASQS